VLPHFFLVVFFFTANFTVEEPETVLRLVEKGENNEKILDWAA
jgi:hypothetical protein